MSGNTITLKGSAKIVSEFFDLAINSILFQRGVYPEEEFEKTSRHGMPVWLTMDKGLRTYLDQLLAQLQVWLVTGEVHKLVLVIADAKSKETRERWNFDIETDQQTSKTGSDKSEKEIQAEIATIIRQIAASVSFLPSLQSRCTFDMLVFTHNDISVPAAWEESEPRFIANSEQVRLASFNTKIHKVDSLVAYRLDE